MSFARQVVVLRRHACICMRIPHEPNKECGQRTLNDNWIKRKTEKKASNNSPMNLVVYRVYTVGGVMTLDRCGSAAQYTLISFYFVD